ncbi:hypothetical protein V499_06010 [Pseudogymnoascus sp. VKM F-103]|nr:hypothetical protein V499_06010 [Pseudogymnoascus sp. VKM F-103]
MAGVGKAQLDGEWGSLTLANLRHGGSPTSTAAPHAAESTLEACHDHGADEAGEEEPEEGAAGLQLAAVAGGGAVVAEDGLGLEDDTCDEGEYGSEGVEDDQNDGDGDGFDDGGGHAVNPDEPAEGDGEHGIVGGWAVGGLAGENVTDEGCDEEDPEELEPTEDDLDDAHDGGVGVLSK